MKKYLIFDLDGTLVDSNTICVGILQEMLIERGVDRRIDLAASVSYMSVGGTHMVSALLEEACHDPVSDLVEFRARYATKTTPRESLYTGVAAGLAHLKDAGHTLTICSNKPVNLCRKVLDDTGLTSLFCAVVGTEPQLRPKPSPDLLDATLAQIGAAPSECVFIGDSDLDCTVATNAQIPFMFMAYGYAPDGWRPAGAPIFECFSDLVDHITCAPTQA
jgi:phosphoglycolate phosphatase